MMALLVAAGLGVVLLGGLAAVALSQAPRVAGSAFASLGALGCGLLAAAALAVLAGGDAWQLRLAATVPGGPWAFGLDALSAVFLLAIALVGAAACVFGAGYLRGAHGSSSTPFVHATVAVLVVALALVVTAQAVVPFLIAWEVMAIAAFLLIAVEHERAESRRAALVYLVSTHAATLALIGMFAAWGSRAPDLAFASLARTGAGGDATLILLLALLAFGLKAGVVPLHFWLPGAHAAAPTHGSALMSGLLIKTGIYGLLRVTALLGGLPPWFGWTLLALGLASGVLGVVWALAQHDLKRLLAYHSVENIGIILIGMGVGALGASSGLPLVATLGYGGAILHVLNHALFKALLFLGAGAVTTGAGSREIDRLGGLGRRMPVTAAAFLVGSVAIVGLPPLNGFVSEWIVIRSLLHAGAADGALRAAVFGVAGLGLIGGLALACFAKVNGVVFLGHPRAEGAAGAREVGALLLAPMAGLAAACVVIGVLPAVVVPPVTEAARIVAGGEETVTIAALGGELTRLTAAGALLLGGVVLAWALRERAMRGRSRVVAHPWGCGYPAPTPRMQYSASSFAQPVLEPFGAVVGLREEREAGRFATHAADPAIVHALNPAWSRLQATAARLRALQLGRLHVYLLYSLATVVALLAYLALRGVP